MASGCTSFRTLVCSKYTTELKVTRYSKAVDHQTETSLGSVSRSYCCCCWDLIIADYTLLSGYLQIGNGVVYYIQEGVPPGVGKVFPW